MDADNVITLRQAWHKNFSKGDTIELIVRPPHWADWFMNEDEIEREKAGGKRALVYKTREEAEAAGRKEAK